MISLSLFNKYFSSQKTKELPDNKQAMDGENDHDQEDQPANIQYLPPQLAFEIYSALPIEHQHRLLALWLSIYEDHPIPDEGTRWKIDTWDGNKWNVNHCGNMIDLSPDGLAITHNNRKWEAATAPADAVFAIHGAFPPIIPKDPVQVCYFEIKYLQNWALIGFCRGDGDLNSGLYLPNGPDSFGVFSIEHDCSLRYGHYGPLISPDPIQTEDVIGCGLLKYFGKRRVFFTKGGELLASVPIPKNAPNELFPAIRLGRPPESRHFLGIQLSNRPGKRFEETNFGQKPFVFKYAGNEEMLFNGLGRDFEMDMDA